MKYTYLDCLAFLGVGGAHPGGLQLTKRMISKENIDETTSILDSGCGTGQTSAYLAEIYGCNVTSVDSSKIMIDKANQRFSTLKLPIKSLLGNTESLPFDNDSFDIVLSESVIAFTNLSLTILEFKRVLKPNGRLLAVEMILENPLTENELEEISHFYEVPRLLTESEWVQEFQHAGFEHIGIEKIEPKFDENSLENAPDFALSENIDDELFFILEVHELLIKMYNKNLGYRIFRCS